MVEFIGNYATINGLPMPAASRGRASNASTYLPASALCVTVPYDTCKAQGSKESVSLSTFK